MSSTSVIYVEVYISCLMKMRLNMMSSCHSTLDKDEYYG